MTDIENWLGELCLAKYVSMFAEAEIEYADLPRLTEEDLKELGLPLGVRDAIKVLGGDPNRLPLFRQVTLLRLTRQTSIHHLPPQNAATSQ